MIYIYRVHLSLITITNWLQSSSLHPCPHFYMLNDFEYDFHILYLWKSVFCPIICFFSFVLIALNASSIGANSGAYTGINLRSNWEKLNIDFDNLDEWINGLSSSCIYLSWDLFRFDQIKLLSIFRNNKKI